MKQLAVMVVAVGLLSACSEQAAEQPWTRWVCENQSEVFWRLTDPQGDKVDVRLGGQDKVYHLVNVPAGSGALYQDGELAFHTKGEQGMVYWTANDEVIGLGCKAP